jgi:PAS domain S-box-containing protein
VRESRLRPDETWGLAGTVLAQVMPVVVLAIFVLVLVGFYLLNSAHTSAARSAVVSAHSQGEEFVATLLGEFTSPALTLAQSDLVRNGLVDTQERYRYLPALFGSIRLARNPDLEVRLQLLDFRGRELISAGTHEVPALRPGDAEQLESGAQIFFFDQSGALFAAPVFLHGSAEGSVTIAMGPEQSWKLLEPLDQFDAAVALWDQDGNLLFANSAWSLDSERAESGNAWLREARWIEIGDNLSLQLVTAIPRPRMVTAEGVVLGSLAALSILAILFAVLLASTLTARPVKRLAEKLDTISRVPESASPLPEEGPAEVSNLADSFNRTLSALQASELQVRALLENLPQGVVVADAQTHSLVFANSRMCALFGYRQDELRALTLPQLFATHERERLKALLTNGRRSGQGSISDIIAQGNHGNQFPADIHTVGLQLDGRPSVCAVVSDMTRWKNAERTLQEAKTEAENNAQMVEEAQRVADIGYWRVDHPSHHVHWSSETYRLHHLRPDEFDNTVEGFMALLTPDSRPELQAAFRNHLADREPFDLVYRIKTKAGDIRSLRSRAKTRRGEDGEPLLTLGIVADITREVEAEQDHLARLQAEAANRAKSAFLANMSHEIRTPMNAILGFTHLLESEPLQPSQKDKLEKIKTSAKHLLGLINDILDLSKIEAEHMKLEQQEFELSEVIGNVCSMICAPIAEKGLEFVQEIDPQVNRLSVVGDSLRLQQVLINHLSNAVKFTDRGRITLRAQVLDTGEKAVHLRFEIEDTGMGIRQEDLPRLFKPFEQADASSTRSFGGTGLGLVISQRFAHLMGGHTGVKSALGKGSTFWFTVTLSRGADKVVDAAAPSDVAATTDAPQPRRDARILLAEDNPINQEVARQLLERVHLHVDTADDGLEALQKVESGQYDLILMDLQMPVMDGLEATRRIRDLENGRDIPVIALTANAFVEDRIHCEEAGMDDYVAKPVDPPRFYATLAYWLPAEGSAPKHVARVIASD